ncbi:MAG TPA: hypothetical protein VFK51_03340 [Burkholderiales bacterium]|jgi:hypothetical protein|nr:hypothetical protein [Burkholderiales bacterium]
MAEKLNSAILDDTVSGARGTAQSPSDAAPDSRVGRMLARRLGAAIAAVVALRYRVEAQGLETVSAAPGTLLLVTHRRDADVPIIGNLIACAPAMKAADRVPHFVAREDLFHSGLLWEYTERWPTPVREALSLINLLPVMRVLHAHPMRRVPEHSVREVLGDALATCGNLPLDQVLKPVWVERFMRLAPPRAASLTTAQALAHRYGTLLRLPHGFRKLTHACFTALEPCERAVIAAHLQCCIDLINRGAVLLLEPEGAVSRDGHFGRLRAALHTLVSQPSIDTRAQPIGISYDFMSPGRTAVFVAVGPLLHGVKHLGHHATCAKVKAALLAQSTITATHLGSRLLHLHAGERLYATDISRFLRQGAAHCAAAGVRVDRRLLDPHASAARTRTFIDYCVRCELLAADSSNRFIVCRDGTGLRRRLADPRHALAHANNELTEIVAAYPGLLERIAR